MVRLGPLVVLALLMLAGVPPEVRAQTTTTAPPKASTSAPKAASDPFIGERPYRIQAALIVEPEARIDPPSQGLLSESWLDQTRRFVGSAWDIDIQTNPGVEWKAPLESLDEKVFPTGPSSPDKQWIIRIGRADAGFALSGREFDTLTERLGPTHRQVVPFTSDLARGLFAFSKELFSPVAEIQDQSGGGVMIHVQGGALPVRSPSGKVVEPGTVFIPVRMTSLPNGTERKLSVPFSYLRARTVEGAYVHCDIISALRDPLTQRIARPTRLIALGIKPTPRPTRLRFVHRPELSPAAGYLLTSKSVPEGIPRELGTTDRQGRIVLEPGFASSLVIVRLLAGGVEPMVELPIMPGESSTERTIPFQPKPETVTLLTRLNALRDSVVDLVAIRARLESRLRARSEGNDWEGVVATLKEFDALTPRKVLEDQLHQLKADAVKEQATTKKAILTKTAQAQFTDVQSLIDRYLDAEVANGFRDALKAHHDEEARKAKTEARKKGTGTRTSP